MIYTIVITLAAWFGGWIYAHKTIADECERLGAFYVGGKVFECKLKEKR